MGNRQKSPAFILIKEGFDVWLGASRGCMYSRKHIRLDPDVDIDEYWDHDW